MEAYRSSSSKDDYVLVVDEAEHGLGGIAGRTGPNAPPEEPDQMQLVFDASTTFWDAYLKKDRNACTKIASGAVVTESEAPARFESRDGVRVRSASAPPQAELATTRATTIVKRMDKNGDGVLSPNELPQQMSRAFDRLDQDGNGTLDEEEAQPIAERFDAQRGAGAGAGGARRRAGGGTAGGGAQSATPRTYPEMPPINQTTPATNAACHYS
jgi:hypothetical protein